MDAAEAFLGQFPAEIFFILALWLVAAAFAFKSGVSRISAVVIALVLSAFLFSQLATAWPFATGAGMVSSSNVPSSILAFAALVLVMVFLMHRIGIDSYSDSGRPAASAIAALAFVLVALALWANIPALGGFYPFPALLAPYFTVQYLFWWLLGPTIALSLISRHRMW